MLIIVISFLSGILSVLAPCVLPVIPVLFGGGLADSSESHVKMRRILFSAMLCIFIFTFLLKVSTAFIGISTQTRSIVSGVIILLYGIVLLVPRIRENIQIHIPQIQTKSSGKRGDYLLGASLGPIFSTCSPTFTLLLATILPASVITGTLGLLAYLFGFGGFLYLLVTGGRSIIKKFYGIADSEGRFKKILGVILIVTGILITTGYMKTLEAKLIDYIPDSGKIESLLIKSLDIVSLEKKHIGTKKSVQPILSELNTAMHHGYKSYDQNAIPQTGDIILFFHADRCPTCNEAEKNFLASDIPAGLTILKVNYDKETELKKKYQILTQTSYVLIKADGTLIKRRVGGRTLQELQAKIAEAKNNIAENDSKRIPSLITATVYLAGGCFRCMEGPLEALEGVKEVVSGYSGGDKSTASYKLVGRGDTGHREAVRVVYDPGLISFEEILATYRTQIDPTDSGGQFGDRGFQYTPAIYWQTTEEQQIAESSKQRLEESKIFDKPIAVTIEAFTTFFDAEEEHQDFYKKESNYYNSYKKGSGRAGFIESNESNLKKIFESTQTETDLSHLTEQQKDILFNGATEPPFNNAYRDHKEPGIYVDVIDGTPLFSSIDKFDSGTGWPAFTRPIDEALIEQDDKSYHPFYGTEVSKDDRHLGHVFDDGPTDKGGKRYCINSAALRFVPVDQMDTPQYRKYLVLFK